ncbi:MAG: ComEC/Rec2 family competence protein [Ginsengibacter sp.]
MAKAYNIYIWKKAPFLRILFPFISGILLQFYCTFPIALIITSISIMVLAYIVFRILPIAYRFKWRSFQGILVTVFMCTAGLFVTWHKDIRHHSYWYGKYYDTSSFIIATINEPPVEKNKSYKAVAAVKAIINGRSVYGTGGNVLLYFAKDSSQSHPEYGDRIIIKKKLVLIKNNGNPAAFDYERYCAFQQIFHQCNLKKSDWILLKDKDVNTYNKLIFKTRQLIITALDTYISGNEEAALANALLIGYKVDLDKDLVQAYTNAGVVHLIAISGLHLALIYGLLIWLTARIPFIKKLKIARLVLVLFCLWFFSLLTGGSASVLRSAVMFSFIATGMTINKRASIYNSLASSAFVLLCYDPFMLWDVGFQLSYLAVAGIVIAQRYIYNWFYFRNKILNETWKLAAVSLSAQLFTLPVCIYYFHQLPLMFLLSNVIAIPLSTVALWGCIIVVCVSPIHLPALYLGKAVSISIWLLNHSVFLINAIPFSLWDGIVLSVTGTILLYIIFVSFLYWLIKKYMMAFKFGILTSLMLAGMIAIEKWQSSHQQKLIVYNVPSHRAIDFISGNSYHFIGDPDLANEGFLRDFHLKPGRISLMPGTKEYNSPNLYRHENFYQFYNKKILLIDSTVVYMPGAAKMNVDYIIISKNPKLFIPALAAVFNCNLYVFDASNPLWKIGKWKKECEELHLHFHSVPEQGAFIKDL